MIINEHQPAPGNSEYPAVWSMVMADMADRDTLGEKRYGTRLKPHNGRDALVDAYQEALDLAVYLRQAIFERDNPKSVLEKDDGWIEWSGGNCPVEASALVEVRFKDGVTGLRCAGQWNWACIRSPYSIVAYRVVNEA